LAQNRKKAFAVVGHTDKVLALAFHPDGRRVISAGADRTALVWDLLDRAFLRDDLKGVGRPDDPARLWRELADRRAAFGLRAVFRLARLPHAAVYLGRRLRPAPARDARRIRRLVAELDSDDSEAREAAAQALEGLGWLAEPELRQALRKPPSAEVRRQAQELLERAARRRPNPQRLRELRAVQALEHAGTPAARRVLQALADGEPLAEMTRDARAALGRLQRQIQAANE
jgi:hypothetical protein